MIPDLQCLDPSDPTTLFRFVTMPEHADDFVAGRVWISTLGACRTHEHHERGDPEEGVLRYNTGTITGSSGDQLLEQRAARAGIALPGSENITLSNNVRTTRLNDAYILCCTEGDGRTLQATFGAHCILIHDPVDLFRRLTVALANRVELKQAVIGKVRYGNRDSAGDDPDDNPLGFIKPQVPYEGQREVRMIWTLAHDHPISPFLLSCDSVGTTARRIA